MGFIINGLSAGVGFKFNKSNKRQWSSVGRSSHILNKFKKKQRSRIKRGIF